MWLPEPDDEPQRSSSARYSGPSHSTKVWLYVKQREWFSYYERGIIAGLLHRVDHNVSLLQRMLPNELLLEVLIRAGPDNAARFACVCRQMRGLARHEALWKAACLAVWKMQGRKAIKAMVHQRYGGCWLDMFLNKPRLRYDGIYVSRNTYVKPGAAGWRYGLHAPVHLVVYYRYYLFRPEGTFAYKTSPNPVRQVAREIALVRKTKNKQNIFCGQWELADDATVTTTLVYPGTRPTHVVTLATLRGTCHGAFNRIDVVGLRSSYEDTFDAEAMANGNANVERNHMERVNINAYVFVPMHEVDSHVLNLPVSELDYYIAG